jgi:hypothetical protein
MNKTELFTALTLRLGHPQELISHSPARAKSPHTTAQKQLDYIREFAETCKLCGFELRTDFGTRRLHAQWARWVKKESAIHN